MSSTAYVIQNPLQRHWVGRAKRPVPAPFSRIGLSGRLSELSGDQDSAALTVAFELVVDAQLEGETCAWVSKSDAPFFPPDAAASGVDLDALVVIVAPDDRAMARAANKLARSGAFGLIMLDFANRGYIPMPLMSRLMSLAQKHNAAIVCLTAKDAEAPSLGSLIFYRGQTRLLQQPDGRYLCRVDAIKDKKRGPGWSHEVVCHGPAGLR